MSAFFGPVTDAERLGWQVRSAYLVIDLLHRAQRIELPLVTWTIANAGASVLIRCETRADWEAWVAATGVMDIWEERRHDSCAHLHAEDDLRGPHAGQVHVAIIADLDTSFEPAAGRRTARTVVMSSAVLSIRSGWPLYAGMTVAGAAAVVASAATLATLARAAGWVGWTPWLLPAALDVGGSVGGWCWLRADAPAGAKRFGRVVALLGAACTLVGNGAGHLLATGYIRPGPALVVIVGAVPAAVLVALAHLAALLAIAPARSPDVVPVAPDETPGLYAPAAAEAPTAAVRPVAAGDTRATVLAVIREAPVTIAELVQATGRSRTTIVGHLAVLTDDGSVARDAGTKRYRAVTRPHLIEEGAR